MSQINRIKVLVTGSEGSLMQAVIPKLLAKGYEVVGVDNLYRHGKRLELTDTSKYDFLREDLTDADAVYGIITNEEPNVIIQGAAKIYGVGGFHKYRADILADDITLQANLLKAAVQTPTVQQFVYISSSMVYENCPTDKPVKEDIIDKYPPPRTDYGLSKYIGERLCKAFWEQYRLPYLIWRPFNIITPYEESEKDIGISHVFADFLNNIVTKKMEKLPLIGDGEQIRCFTWIDDVAQAIADYSVNSTETINQAFNLGNQEPITMKGLAALIHEEAQKMGLLDLNKELEFKPGKSYNDDVRVRIPDTTYTDGILGWKATKTVRGSIRACLEQMKSK